MDIYPIHNYEELEAAQEKLEQLLETETYICEEDEALIQLLTIAISDFFEKNHHTASINCASNMEPQPAER
ncbi:MAG: hypothetical protein GY750_06515 [Lentisphaerae bacterium]|nr:hypothetical protein [Lentisphaerota bacterium]MCP4101062.1 hypothetical protein [Lentisphaerota bacterium]